MIDLMLQTFTATVTSANAIGAAEAAGRFLPINPGPGNPYEIDTGTVLIGVFVSPHA